ncbi:MAG: DUF6445 family protein [Gammaproteobacteria bacterium]|nr:hypothetical protein [Pseudomonadales bacterium]MCP5348145.1 hypothetical protein [Pseudomonadales bacterium]
MALEFNPDCRIEVRQLRGGSALVIVDDALLNPEHLVTLASEKLPDLIPDDRWHYPGVELALPESYTEPCAGFLRHNLREYFGLSRVIWETYARLSMITVPPEQLTWKQRMCHIDANPGVADERVIASVLYLFPEADLGGTAFFEPRPGLPPYLYYLSDGLPTPESEQFEFFRQPPAYHTDSNEFFELDQAVTPRWNRMIFYRGDVHHSANVTAPQRLSRDPTVGRLTLNGFYRVAATGG